MNQDIDKRTGDIIGAVMVRISKRRLAKARFMVVFHVAMFAGTIAAFIPVMNYAADRASQSGFAEYASLVFSDWGYVVSSWRSLLLSMAESAPILSAAALLSIILIFVYSLRGTFKDVSAMRQAMSIS
ncbi:MAG: hypothetical protein KGI49_02745 [Patescibacteria group bacterium]|nr:hypothetical protein [Patescibacteria group bacterium]